MLRSLGQPSFGAIHTVVEGFIDKGDRTRPSDISASTGAEEVARLLNHDGTYYDSPFGTEVRARFLAADPDYAEAVNATEPAVAVKARFPGAFSDLIVTGKTIDALSHMDQAIAQLRKLDYDACVTQAVNMTMKEEERAKVRTDCDASATTAMAEKGIAALTGIERKFIETEQAKGLKLRTTVADYLSRSTWPKEQQGKLLNVEIV